MGKMAAIEFLTVGAIQMESSKDKPEAKAEQQKEKTLTVVKVVPSGPKTARIHPPQEEIDAHRREAVAAVKVKKGLWSRFFG